MAGDSQKICNKNCDIAHTCVDVGYPSNSECDTPSSEPSRKLNNVVHNSVLPEFFILKIIM
jgi:hypothetical protein